MARISTQKQFSQNKNNKKKEAEMVPGKQTIDNILAFAKSYTPTGLKQLPDKGMILN